MINKVRNNLQVASIETKMRDNYVHRNQTR